MIKTFDGNSFKRVGGKPGDRTPALGIKRDRAVYVAVGGETSINLANLTPPLSYLPGNAQVSIKRSSATGSMISGLDFYEVTSTSVGFPASEPLLAGEWVEITKEVSITGVMAVTARPDAYTAVGVAGQTLITADFSWPYNLNSSKAVGGVQVMVHGIVQTRGIDYTEVNLGTQNTNQITLTDALVGGENIQIIPTYQVIDQTAAANTFAAQQITAVQNELSVGTQAFVDQSATISVPSTAIVGRAPIPNIAQDLRASFGIERIMTQQISSIQNEFGPNGEPVWAAVNDDRGLIRFVGGGWALGTSYTYGSYVTTPNPNDYVEITFYGTGLNILSLLNGGVGGGNATDYRVSIDGGAEGSNVVASPTAYSSVIGGRNYGMNNSLNIASGLVLGIHTVKVRFQALGNQLNVYGFEVLNTASTTSISVNPGTAYAAGQKYTASLAQSLAYTSGVTGTKGGRQLVYLKSDGTIGNAFQAVNATQAYLSAADHTNEEVARSYFPGEFGAGRSDDWSLSAGSNIPRAFTLDDGTTTLVSTSSQVGPYGGKYGIYFSLSNTVTLTFVGTGIDFEILTGSSEASTYGITLDGASIGNMSYSLGATRVYRIASGLPYGTHTVKIAPTGTSPSQIILTRFVVYQPKKPALPQGAVELADFNVMANYALNTSQDGNLGHAGLSTGILAKSPSREVNYFGTWGAGVTIFPTSGTGFYVATATNNDAASYTFFGTGIEISTTYSGSTFPTQTIQIDGVAYTGAATPTNGTTWTAGTSTWSGSAPPYGALLSISGLSLGLHTVRVTFTNAATTQADLVGFGVITPIHSVKSNLYADLQNTLPVGSCSLSDNRKTSMIKEALPAQKAWAQAFGVSSSPSTTTSGSIPNVPMPDMSLTIKTNGGALQLSYSLMLTSSATNNGYAPLQFAVDGVLVGTSAKGPNIPNANNYMLVSDIIIVPVSAGVHKVDLMWCGNSATVATYSNCRCISAREI